MKLKIFSVFDAKAEIYGSPFFMAKDGEAIRAFKDLVNDDRSTVNKHPEDYVLHVLGEFENAEGRVIGHTPTFVVAARTLVNDKELVKIDGPSIFQLNGEGSKAEVK